MNIREIQSHELQLLLSLYAHLHKRDDPPPSAAVTEEVWSEALANPRIKYFGGFASGSLGFELYAHRDPESHARLPPVRESRMSSLMRRIVVKAGARLSCACARPRPGNRIATRSCCSPAEKTKPRYDSMSKRVSISMVSRHSSPSPGAVRPDSFAGAHV